MRWLSTFNGHSDLAWFDRVVTSKACINTWCTHLKMKGIFYAYQAVVLPPATLRVLDSGITCWGITAYKPHFQGPRRSEIVQLKDRSSQGKFGFGRTFF